MDPLRRLFGSAPNPYLASSVPSQSPSSSAPLPVSPEDDHYISHAHPPNHSFTVETLDYNPETMIPFEQQQQSSLRSVFNMPTRPSLVETSRNVSVPVQSLARPPSLPQTQRRARLDESAGEGLRRSVLVRNAMLSSLEREKCQGDLGYPLTEFPFETSRPTARSDGSSPQEESREFDFSSHSLDESMFMSQESMNQERQWFENVVDQLLDDEDCDVDYRLESSPESFDEEAEREGDREGEDAEEEEDFVEIELPGKEGATSATTSSSSSVWVGKVQPTGHKPRRVQHTFDSGFAETVEVEKDAASPMVPKTGMAASGYPHICPYPPLHFAASSSSDELPALIDDDSDLEEDEDECVESKDVHTPLAGQGFDPLQDAIGSIAPSRSLSPASSAPAGSSGVGGCADLDMDMDTSSSPVRRNPSPELATIVQHVTIEDDETIRTTCSSPISRPTSPATSSSSKDSDLYAASQPKALIELPLLPIWDQVELAVTPAASSSGTRSSKQMAASSSSLFKPLARRSYSHNNLRGIGIASRTWNVQGLDSTDMNLGLTLSSNTALNLEDKLSPPARALLETVASCSPSPFAVPSRAESTDSIRRGAGVVLQWEA
ncbi:hypothetical protein IE53DRAFT_359361 [Violaceomyces palustris]|uniref:Uncharacterized protein n=1 Tax=Violaceomyces palustris TaxID=1673888 RepID=A0ACD0P860_9BASI|nr:hypothetical protein IE53DRAFT_359361 [Violaceomyces palustris]